METFEARLKRFLFGPPDEVFLTILNSISSFSLQELKAATDGKLYSLALLGAHSVMQTIGEQVYGQAGVAATTFYLRNFVDGDTDDTRFSEIAKELHTFRNVHTHRWSSRFNHDVGFDTSKDHGWWRDDDGLHINPVVFMKCFSAGFMARRPMWTEWRAFDEVTAIQRKYSYLRRWFEVDKDTEAYKAVATLEGLADLDAVKKHEKNVQGTIMAHFGFKMGDAD